MVVENAAMVRGKPASISTSLARLLQVRLGTTEPPDRKIRSCATQMRGHCLRDGDGQSDGIELAECTVDFSERSPYAGREPDLVTKWGYGIHDFAALDSGNMLLRRLGIHSAVVLWTAADQVTKASA